MRSRTLQKRETGGRRPIGGLPPSSGGAKTPSGRDVAQAAEKPQTQAAPIEPGQVRQRDVRRVKLLNPKMSQAKAYARSGFAVLPICEQTIDGCACRNPKCSKAGKHPRTPNGVKDASTNLDLIGEWWTRWPNANIGIATGAASNLTVVDLDGKAALAAFLQLSGLAALPSKATIMTARGHHVYYRSDGLVIGNSAGKLAPGIDVRGEGGYVIAHGSQHASGAMYRLQGWSMWHHTIVPEPVPHWLAALGTATGDKKVAAPAAEDNSKIANYGEAALSGELEKLLAASEGQRNDTLNTCAFKLGQLCAAGALDEVDVVVQLTRAAMFIGLEEAEIASTIGSGLSAGKQSPRSPSPAPAPAEEKAEVEVDELAEALAKLPHTDAANAERLARRHGDKLLWTPGHKWHCFDGRIWAPDVAKRRLTLALDTAEKIANEAAFTDDGACRRHALSSQSKGALDRMVSLAEPPLAKPDAALDADPWKLSVANGTLDLRTAVLSPHKPSDLITKIIPTEFDASAECPRFDAFMRHALKDDDDLITFVQKAVGMCLTGSNREQVFFCIHGPGGTGKSTFLNLIREMLGSYAMHTSTETWLASNKNQATQPELARLQGTRMATAIEANFDQKLDEAKLKGVTGGEPITCRGLYQSTFEYVPQFKLWFAVNDLPAARSTADAFWRRARVITFDVPIEAEDRDLELDTKLKAEFPGILAWAVRGCLAWQHNGLTPPAAVRDATKQWQVKVDHLTRFVREALIRDASSPVQSSFVYTHYTDWCARQGEKPRKTSAFKAALEAENFEHYRRDGRSYWRGMRLRIE